MYITQDLLRKYGDKRGHLTEVKKGETGTGLLIEHDGHIIGNHDMVSQIKEDIEHHKEFVIPDKFIVSAVFQKYGIKNANGRVYPEAILKREVEKYINERVRVRASVGALDHPESSTLSGHDVSHVITNLQWQGHTLIGEMELHLTPGYRRYGIPGTSGDLAANMILNDILIGVSSRGVGSVEEKLGVLVVGEDLELIGWDIVLEPSTPNAYIAKNMQDLVQFIESDETKNDKSLVNEKIDRINKILL
jgi:hypothetical protein